LPISGFSEGGNVPDERPLAIGFSDLRGFTSYTAKRGDREAYRVAKTFIEMAEEQAAAEGGAVLKAYGDGVMTSFEIAEQALHYASGMQRALHSFNERHKEEPVSAGIGLTWGSAIREQGDLFGHSVNLAKRLADIAKGGQIVISSPLYDLTKTYDEFSFRDLGEPTIKGLGSQSLYELIWLDEVANLCLTDDTLNVVLTEDDKLVLEFAKPIEEKLLALRQRLERTRDGSAVANPIKRAVADRLTRQLPRWMKAAERLAGVAVEQHLKDVEAHLDKGKLTILLPGGRRLCFTERQIDPVDAERFLEKFRELKGSITRR